MQEKVDKLPEIIYIPGADNRYLLEYDVIVLDRNLKKYPYAHEYILKHELEHSEIDNSLTHIALLEFSTDLKHFFSTEDTLREVRYYLKKEQSGFTLIEAFKHNTLILLRSSWNSILYPTGLLYRKIKGVLK